MPSGILPDEGIADQLTAIVGVPSGSSTNWNLFLFVNDITPSFDTVLADLEEATWDGYMSVLLDRSTWKPPTVFEGCATSVYGDDPIEFDVGDDADQTNYGCAYVDHAAGVIRFVQRFDPADIAPVTPGGRFSILPQYTLTSAACGSMMARAKRKIRRAKGEKKRG